MQDHNWNDLKVLLAVLRSDTLADAARTLGVNETTVPRRLRNLERSLGVELFVRSVKGRYDPTDVAVDIARNCENIELEQTQILEKAGARRIALQGTVRVSAVPIIVNRFLVPRLCNLRHRHPELHVELLSEARNVDLVKREADLAIRFARPEIGGLNVRAQKLGDLAFSIYGPANVPPEDARSLGWIGYDRAHASLPQARRIEAVLKDPEQAASCLWVSDAETALEAVACGQGQTLLPDCVGAADPRLRRLPNVFPEGQGLSREIWLLSHSDQSGRASVAAAKDWLKALDWRA